MKKQNLISIIMGWVATIGFKLFIWGNQTTQEKYWGEIWQQENALRSKSFPEQPEEQNYGVACPPPKSEIEGMNDMEKHLFQIHGERNPGLSEMELIKSFYNQFPTLKKRVDERNRVTPIWETKDGMLAFEFDDVYILQPGRFGYLKTPRLVKIHQSIVELPGVVIFSDKQKAKDYKHGHNISVNEQYMEKKAVADDAVIPGRIVVEKRKKAGRNQGGC